MTPKFYAILSCLLLIVGGLAMWGQSGSADTITSEVSAVVAAPALPAQTSASESGATAIGDSAGQLVAFTRSSAAGGCPGGQCQRSYADIKSTTTTTVEQRTTEASDEGGRKHRLAKAPIVAGKVAAKCRPHILGHRRR